MLKKKLNTAKTLLSRFIKRLWLVLSEGILRILPYKRNRIVFSSFIGKNYSCNPRAIYEYLLHHYGDRFAYVWLFDYAKDPEIPPIVSEHAKCVQTESLRCKYYKATSGFWVFNHRNISYFHKKKGQFYLQTWHGDLGFKALDGGIYPQSAASHNAYVRKCLVDSSMIDAILSGSDWGANMMRHSFYCPETEIWVCGYPRTDFLLHPGQSDAYASVRERYGLRDQVKICLYAPTFRQGFQINELIFADGQNRFEQIMQALQHRFGGEWVIFMRVHPACLQLEKTKHYAFGAYVIDASAYPDMQDLLVAADAFISDYSSASFEFALTRKPCWLYTVDWNEYKKHTKTVLELSEVRLDTCMSFSQLLEAIENFNETDYCANVDRMLREFGSHETGTASQFVAEKFVRILEQQ